MDHAMERLTNRDRGARAAEDAGSSGTGKAAKPVKGAAREVPAKRPPAPVKPAARPAKPTRMKIVWEVCSGSGKVIQVFAYPEKAAAEARLRALIRRSAGKTTNVIEIGDVSVDTAARIVALSGKPVELTAREYTLVEFMVLHRGEVVTRTQLYEHLFDENDSSLSNLLDVHVSNVRKKLGAEFITTRRGHGYCIE